MAKQTLKELQKELDLQKYYMGFQNNCDNSGQMWYCDTCKYKCNYGCMANHGARINNCYCAKASKGKLQ